MTESYARAELTKRGITEAQFREEMQKRGINLDNIDPNNPQELFRLEKEVKEVIALLEKRNQDKTNEEKAKATKENKDKKVEQDTVPAKETNEAKIAVKSGNDIKKAVERGATLEEAVAENLQEKQKDILPDPITFGQQLFRDNTLKLYRTVEDAKPPRTYVLGAGDVVAISIFDASQANFALEISRDGFIQPERLPRYYIAGLTIDEAERLLKKNFRNYYYFSPDNFKLTVTTARTINVNIFGEVFNNGSFNISAVNTAFNALVAAGGPNNLGSVRLIKLLRPGKPPKTIDVYQFLNNPVISQEFYLQDNDYIQVPVAQKVVSVLGGVNRPMKYELLEQENLNDLLRYAGGLKADALRRNIQITRFQQDAESIINVNLTELQAGKKDFELKQGDLIKIKEISDEFENVVKVYGAVRDTGEYAFTAGLKISDLLNKAVLKDNAILETAYLRRFNPDQSTVRYELVNISEALKNVQSNANITLMKGGCAQHQVIVRFC
ncbi:MAG: SLBB domain-containing protein [Saprospiraceae bacterium]|nr:SLBB domain-containing protein [Saprospiraceae bacterium]